MADPNPAFRELGGIASQFGADRAIAHATLLVLDHDGRAYGFPNWSRLVYAGNGLFSSEEDVYNPARDAPRVVGEWMKAGGRLAAPVPSVAHG